MPRPTTADEHIRRSIEPANGTVTIGNDVWAPGRVEHGIDPLEAWKHRKDTRLVERPPVERSTTVPSRLLVAEDDDEMRRLLETAFRDAGYAVTSCGDGWSLLRLLAEYFLSPERDDAGRFDLIVSDVCMPGLTGLEILEGSQSVDAFPPMILTTAFGDAEIYALADSASAAALFDKPFDIDILLNKARELVPPTAR